MFVALAETIREFQMPPDPLLDLLVAFRQDQRQTRYETTDEVLEYCRYSANPVGRLVLYLARCHTPERARLSDTICTGLQLANFCQDVARDWDRGRIYLPQADCRRFGYNEATFARRECQRGLSGACWPTRSIERRAGFATGLPLGGQDAAGVAAAGGVVCRRRLGYAGGRPPPALRRMDPAADRRPRRKTAIDVELLVENAFRKVTICGSNWKMTVDESYAFCRQ